LICKTHMPHAHVPRLFEAVPNNEGSVEYAH